MKFLLALAALVVLGAAQTPDCAAFSGWQQRGDSRLYEGENLFEYIDGNSEGYLIYGFVRMHGVTCGKGNEIVLVDVSEFPDGESAYGMFLANRDIGKAIEAIGTGGQVVPRKVIFTKDKYYVEMADEAEGDHTAELREMARTMEARIAGSTARPEALKWFPPGMTGGTARLVPQSVLGIRALERGYVAQYGDAKAFVVTEDSAEAAKATMVKLRERLNAREAVPIADEAFRVTDEYLGGICIFRKGRRIAGYANVAAGQDAAVPARILSARVPE